jgi:hypothetical protein
MAIRLIAPPSSLGIRDATTELGAALRSAGLEVTLADRLGREDARSHVHLGNSTRSLLMPLARRHNDLVTLHDVIARSRTLRRLLTPVQMRVIARHHVAVHSPFARDLLAGLGFAGTIHVLAPLTPITRVDPALVAELRSAWSCEEFEVTLVAAGQLRTNKGVAELIEASRRRPATQLVLVGRAHQRSMRRLIQTRPPNVRHLEAPGLSEFCHYIAAGDALVTLRRDSVGESSGPVVQAHRLRRPVVGLAMGSLPYDCAEGDLLVDPAASALDLLDAAAAAGLKELPPTSPQISSPTKTARITIELYEELGLTDS